MPNGEVREIEVIDLDLKFISYECAESYAKVLQEEFPTYQLEAIKSVKSSNCILFKPLFSKKQDSPIPVRVETKPNNDIHITIKANFART
ncbi:MAG: hypothetical protein ACR2M6_02675 [Vampirovibrionia bacterium]